MMNIALIDDDANFIMFLKKLIQGLEIIDSYEITSYNTAHEFYYEGKHFDIILLDIKMPEMDGITLAKNLYDESSLIIYITSFTDKMDEAFFINVFKYIVKKEVKVKLEKTLNDAISFINSRKVISAKTDLGFKNFRSNELTHIIYFNRSVYIYTKSDEYVGGTTTLEDIENKLPKIFIRINRSTIINSLYIESFKDNKVKLKYYEKTFKVSRRKKEDIIKVLVQRVDKL